MNDKARLQLAELRKTMFTDRRRPDDGPRWTAEAPSEPGWYWQADQQGAVVGVVRVVRKRGELVYERDDGEFQLEDWRGWWWVPPLQAPPAAKAM